MTGGEVPIEEPGQTRDRPDQHVGRNPTARSGARGATPDRKEDVMDSVEPVRAVLTFGVLAEDAERFEAEWRRVAAAAARQPGCLGQSLCRYDDGGLRYVISSDWADLAAFRAFERSPEQDALTAGLRRLRQSIHMRVMLLVADEPTVERAGNHRPR